MKRWMGLGLAVGAIVATEILYFGLIRWYQPEIQKTGQFGDTFGGLTALFTGLAFAGALYAIWEQNKDAERRDERYAEQIKVLTEQARHSSEMTKALYRQLKVSTIAARLNVLPSLIEQEVLHMSAHHATQLQAVGLPPRVDGATDEAIAGALKKVDRIVTIEKRHACGEILTGNDANDYVNFGNSSSCVQRNLRTLLDYRKDMKTLYGALIETEKAP